MGSRESSHSGGYSSSVEDITRPLHRPLDRRSKPEAGIRQIAGRAMPVSLVPGFCFLQKIERAHGADSAFLHDVKVDLGRLDALVTEQLLHRADVGAIFQHMGRKRVSKYVGCHPLVESRSPCRPADAVLKGAIKHMVAPQKTGDRVNARLPGRE